MRVRARAHLTPIEVAIPVPRCELRLEAGRWLLVLDPFYWQRGRYNFPREWWKLPPVDGEVAPIVRSWSFGPLHAKRFRWRSGDA